MTTLNIEGQQIEITHEDKVLFPKVGITKKDVVGYYLNVSDYILPLIKDRPITIMCFPKGIEEPGYYRQHAQEEFPAWIKQAKLEKKDLSNMNHILCQNKATLAYLANYNTITIHRWLSKYTSPNFPDVMIIDIDPPENRFDLACKYAKILKKEVEKIGYTPLVMTTGSKGLHIILPVAKRTGFEKTKDFLSSFVKDIVNKYPHELTTEVSKEKRHSLVYLDILRNAYGQTAVAPYSIRAKDEAPIAMPIRWEELDEPSFHSRKYTITNVFTKLKSIKRSDMVL